MDAVGPEIENCSAGLNFRTTPKYVAVEHGTPKIEIRKPENKTGFFLNRTTPSKRKLGFITYVENKQYSHYSLYLFDGAVQY
jgi:hypothetical protein